MKKDTQGVSIHLLFFTPIVTYISLHRHTVAVETVSNFGHGFQTDGVTACPDGFFFPWPITTHVLCRQTK